MMEIDWQAILKEMLAFEHMAGGPDGARLASARGYQDERRRQLAAYIGSLEAMVDTAEVVVGNKGGCASGGWREGAAFLAMANALVAVYAAGRELNQCV